MLALEAENNEARAQLARTQAAEEQSRAEAERERASAEEARARAAAANESLTTVRADATRDATALEREIRCVHLLAGALAEAEFDMERAARALKELGYENNQDERAPERSVQFFGNMVLRTYQQNGLAPL